LIDIGRNNKYQSIQWVKDLKSDQFHILGNPIFFQNLIPLPITDVIDFMIGLIITESTQYKDWGAGSTSPVIKVHNFLKRNIKSLKKNQNDIQDLLFKKLPTLSVKITNPYLKKIWMHSK